MLQSIMHYTSREVYEFISRQTNDPIVERKTCVISGQPFAIYQSDLDFYKKISPTFNSQKFQIPTPTLCPEERQRRRLSFRNERKLYRRQCDASKKTIISIYSPDKPYKVYDQKIRRSDARDPMEYGMDFDFTKTFTENFRKLQYEVPRISLLNGFSENTEYANHARRQSNCYLSFAAGENKNCMYGVYMNKCSDCIDCTNIYQSEYLSNSIDCNNCYQCSWVFNLKSSNNCHFSQHLENCSFCFGCSNLQNKKYYIYNKPYTQHEYETIIGKKMQGASVYPESNNNLNIHIGLNILESQNSIGSNIKNSSNSYFIYDSFDSLKCKNSTYIWGGNYIYDCDIAGSENSFNLLEGHTVIGSQHLFGNLIWGGDNNIYCDYLLGICNHCFGCIGLRNKSYCIFNKQYTKEEYEIQVANIIAHMQQTGERGEFFHPSLSPFGYNETVAQEYFPLPQDLVRTHGNASDPVADMLPHVPTDYSKCGYHRSTYNADPSLPAGVQTVERKNYSDEQRTNLLQQENLETKVFLCSVSGRPYRLQKAEIAFYRKHQLPIPDKHTDIRHEERMKLRPGRTLFLRNCDCCEKEMLSVYLQTYEGKVYCEECYQQEVYGY